ncbi:MAG: hypothetical protein P8Z41_08365, partial [Anaerolineales bacterium]
HNDPSGHYVPFEVCNNPGAKENIPHCQTGPGSYDPVIPITYVKADKTLDFGFTLSVLRKTKVDKSYKSDIITSNPGMPEIWDYSLEDPYSVTLQNGLKALNNTLAPFAEALAMERVGPNVLVSVGYLENGDDYSFFTLSISNESADTVGVGEVFVNNGIGDITRYVMLPSEGISSSLLGQTINLIGPGESAMFVLRTNTIISPISPNYPVFGYVDVSVWIYSMKYGRSIIQTLRMGSYDSERYI